MWKQVENNQAGSGKMEGSKTESCKSENSKLKNRVRWAGMLMAVGIVGMNLTGCKSALASLADTSWKVTELKTPEGTAYEEKSYDTIIGPTVYHFDENGKMLCTIGDAGMNDSTYQYTYADG
ncbi:MAG: hypothetical protein PHE06_11790 [Lachnospiraceae bacterium]|nr:hypothetical protein [Lachnospiraceae bacterium]